MRNILAKTGVDADILANHDRGYGPVSSEAVGTELARPAQLLVRMENAALSVSTQIMET